VGNTILKHLQGIDRDGTKYMNQLFFLNIEYGIISFISGNSYSKGPSTFNTFPVTSLSVTHEGYPKIIPI